jgi:hypothetical protein
MHETPPIPEWRFMSMRWSLASQQIMGDGWIHRAFAGYLGWSAASLAAALTERLLFLRAGRKFQQPVHHWHPPTSNRSAVWTIVCFHGFAKLLNGKSFCFW